MTYLLNSLVSLALAAQIIAEAILRRPEHRDRWLMKRR